MLVIDHAERITAKDALEHPYFDAIKPDRAEAWLERQQEKHEAAAKQN